MNPHTGHLTNDPVLFTPEHRPLPAELQGAAAQKLNGAREAHVSLTSGGKLADWARKERNKAKAKRKRKLVKALRRKNR